MLAKNVGIIGGFSRALLEGTQVFQSNEEFTSTLESSCRSVFLASRPIPPKEEKLIKLASQEGFFAGFDQSEAASVQVLESYGIGPDKYSNEAKKMELLHEMRVRICTNSKFNGSRVIGALLTQDTMDRHIGESSTATFLWQQKRIVPFLKIDSGLAKEKDGVQMMLEIPKLERLLDKAIVAGILGTIARSVIRRPNIAAIKMAVAQQFDIAKKISSRGLVPILQLEVDIQSSEKASCERILRQSLLDAMKSIGHLRVILDLSLPSQANAYQALVEHENVIRVLALSGGYTREVACKKITENPGMIASFGRAFLSGLEAKQTERAFTAALEATCAALYKASSSSAGEEGDAKDTAAGN